MITRSLAKIRLVVAALSAMGVSACEHSAVEPVAPPVATAREWRYVPPPDGGSVSALANVSDGLLAGSMGRGLWKRTGGAWQQITGYPTGGGADYVWALAPMLNGTWLVGSQIGLLRSADLGNSWQLVRGGATASAIASRDDAVLVGTLYRGLLRSIDGGQTFLALPSPMDTAGILSLVAASGTTWYAGTTSGVYRSVDNGVQWERVLVRGIINCLLVSRDGTVFAGSRVGGLYRSVDGGTTWTATGGAFAPLPDAFPDALAQSTSGRLFANVDMSLYSSDDDGISWTLRSSSGDRIRALAAGITGSLMIGAEDGFWTSDDGGMSRRLQGIVPLSLTHVAGGNSLIVAADDGTMSAAVYRREGDGWMPVYGPDLRLNELKRTTTGLLLMTVSSTEEPGHGFLLQSGNDGEEWNTVAFGAGEPTTVTVAPDGTWLLGLSTSSGASARGIRTSVDAGGQWTDNSAGLSIEDGSRIAQIVCDATSRCYVLLTRTNGRATIYVRDAGGKQWAARATPTSTATCLAVATDGRVLLGTERGIYTSPNAGRDWHAAAGVTASITSLDVDVHGAAYAGTANGLFVSADHGVQWQPADAIAMTSAIRSVRHDAANRLYLLTGSGVVVGTPR